MTTIYRPPAHVERFLKANFPHGCYFDRNFDPQSQAPESFNASSARKRMKELGVALNLAKDDAERARYAKEILALQREIKADRTKAKPRASGQSAPVIVGEAGEAIEASHSIAANSFVASCERAAKVA